MAGSAASNFCLERHRTYRADETKFLSRASDRASLQADIFRSVGRWRRRWLSKTAKATKKIPIFGRRRVTFDTRRQADSYAIELAKLWIDGRLWGANGHG